MTKIRVKDPAGGVDVSRQPFQMEIEYEKRNLIHSLDKKIGVVYEGMAFLSILRKMIEDAELSPFYLHIVLTNQLFATWSGGRYHVRTILCSVPSVISTSGLVEGPAKPKKFYLLKRRYLSLNKEEVIEKLKEDFRDEFLDYNDKRITEVVKGYLMQAVFYYLTGEPFCADSNCRAYNAHWQKELLQAQAYSPYEFCPYHERMLNESNSFNVRRTGQYPGGKTCS